MADINELLEKNPIVPLVQADDPRIAVETSRALAAGGLTAVEVVFRTDRALECLQGSLTRFRKSSRVPEPF